MLGELALGSLSGLGLPPLIKWPGGKYRFAHKLKHRIPPHRVYVEPFFGGGSMFFIKDEAPVSILGDVTRRTIRFHVAARKGALRGCKVRLNKATWDRAQRANASACDVFAASFMSYHGSDAQQPSGIRRSTSAVGAAKLRRLEEYEGMLRRAHLTLGDFARTVRLGDRRGGREAFYFLDPPWPGVGKYGSMYEKLGGRDGADDDGKDGLPPSKVRRVMDGVKGKAWVIYNDHPAVRAAFCGRSGRSGRSGKWRCYHVSMPVADPHRGGMRRQKWILATNYDVKR